MHLIKELQERRIRHFLGIKNYLQRFGVPCAAATDGAVGRGGSVAADIADAGVEKALVGEILAEEVLDAPETAGCYGALLGVRGDVFGACGVGFGLEGEAS